MSSGSSTFKGNVEAVLKVVTAITIESVIQAIALHIMKRCFSILLDSLESCECDGRSGLDCWN